MKIYLFYNPKLKTNLSRILSKDFLENRLVKLIYKVLKLVIKTKNKI